MVIKKEPLTHYYERYCSDTGIEAPYTVEEDNHPYQPECDIFCQQQSLSFKSSLMIIMTNSHC